MDKKLLRYIKFLPPVIALFVIAGCSPLLSSDSSSTAPNATQTLQSTEAASQVNIIPYWEATVLFEDDFSNPGSGWRQWEDRHGAGFYKDEKFHILIKEPGIGWNEYPLDFDDVRLEIAATIPQEDAFVGLACRIQGVETYYMGVVSKTEFKITRNIEGNEESLVSGSVDPSLYNEGRANKITLDCQESNLNLFINGILVATVQDSSLVQGAVSFSAGTFEGARSVVFDNFSLFDLSVEQDQQQIVFGGIAVRARLITGEPVRFMILALGGENLNNDDLVDRWSVDGSNPFIVAPGEYLVFFYIDEESISMSTEPDDCRNPHVVGDLWKNTFPVEETVLSFVPEPGNTILVRAGEITTLDLIFECEIEG